MPIVLMVFNPVTDVVKKIDIFKGREIREKWWEMRYES